jgi:uncharacterized protein
MSITERVVIDTNVFITIFKKDGENRWMFDKILKGEWILCLNHEIFMEYWELLEDKMTVQIASNIIDFLISHPHVLFLENFIRLNLISVDADDNKFCDCCFAASTNFIVSNDKHFNILQNVEFPKNYKIQNFTNKKILFLK